MKALLALAFAAAMAGPAVAQQVRDCDWLASAWNLAEPWEENTRTFANGAVRLALLDAIEPGAVPFHLLVLSPPYDELGARGCKVVSYEQGFGFHHIHFEDLVADYAPAVGLRLVMPVEIWIDTGNILVRGLEVTVNQASGAVAAEILTE